jgi:hypothetical protein
MAWRYEEGVAYMNGWIPWLEDGDYFENLSNC